MRCRSRAGLIAFTILSLVWMAVIFAFSALSGEESGSQSGWIVDIITALLPFDISPEATDILTFAVRKLAHFTEYAILGTLYIQALRAWDRNDRERLWLIISTALCFIYAATDEFHQSFTDGRGPSVRDVFIDAAGGFFGGAVSVIIIIMYRKRGKENDSGKDGRLC